MMNDSQPQEQEDRPTDYSFESIKGFLDETKGHRIQVRKHFPSRNALIESVNQIGLKINTGESSDSVFSDQEIFRLKKWIAKAKFEIVKCENEFLSSFFLLFIV